MSIKKVNVGEPISGAITEISNNVLSIDLDQSDVTVRDHEVKFVYVTYDKNEYVDYAENMQKKYRYTNLVLDRPVVISRGTSAYEVFTDNFLNNNANKQFFEYILDHIDQKSIFRNTDTNSNRYSLVDFANNVIPPIQNINQVTGEIINIESQNIDEFSVVNNVAADFIGQMTQNAANNIFSNFNESSSVGVQEAFEIQAQANATANSNVNQNNTISLRFTTLPVGNVSVARLKNLAANPLVIGYNIYKYETKTGKNDSLIDVTFVSNLYRLNDVKTKKGNVSFSEVYSLFQRRKYTYKDYDILMGKKYTYEIFPVFVYSIFNENAETLKFTVIESRYFKRFSVTTDDVIKPNPPHVKVQRTVGQNLKISWVPNQQSNVTINNVRQSVNDTKGYLIFKRNTINDAFELIKAFDFSDSVGYKNPINNILKDVPQNLKSFGTRHVTSFNYNINDDEDYIFTVCSYDARGNISNLSNQIFSRINSATNIFVKETVCQSGAQLQQPNLYINNVPNRLDNKIFLSDSLNASKYKNIKIYHCPENNTITKKVNKDSANPNYKVQLIDIFTQQQKIVDLYLEEEV